MKLDGLFAELAEVDRDLAACGCGDFDRFRQVLAAREPILSRINGLLQQGTPVTEEQHKALVRSFEAGVQAKRQLILARHLLVDEHAELDRRRQWSQSASGSAAVASSLDVRG